MEVDGELQQGGELATNETDKEKRDNMEKNSMPIHEGYLLGYCDIEHGGEYSVKDTKGYHVAPIRDNHAVPNTKDTTGGDCVTPTCKNKKGDYASTADMEIEGDHVAPSAKETGGRHVAYTAEDTGGDHVLLTGMYDKTEEEKCEGKSLSASCPHILPLLKHQVIGAPKINSEIGQVVFDPQNKDKKFIR